MNTLTQYQYLFAIIPAMLVLLAGYFTGCFPKRSAIVKILDSFGEKDLRKLLDRAGLSGTSVAVYILIRLVFATVTTVIIWFITSGEIRLRVLSCIIAFYGMYKLLYLFLVIKEKSRISKLNLELPYAIKAISYLCYLYPVTNAFQRAVEYVPETFREDVVLLLKDIDEDPLTFAPYQKWIDRYEGKLNMLDVYLHNLYRMGNSTSKEQNKLLANLNSSISSETKRSRKMKNENINSSISWFGMLPVGYLAVMMIFMLLIVASSI